MRFSANNDHWFTANGLKNLFLSPAMMLEKVGTNDPWNFAEAFQSSNVLYRLYKSFHQIRNILII